MLKHASVVISFTLAVLYALGLTLHQGFLSELGIEETQFTQTPDRVFFQGFVAYARFSAEAFKFQFAAALTLCGLSILMLILGKFIGEIDLTAYVPKFKKDRL